MLWTNILPVWSWAGLLYTRLKAGLETTLSWLIDFSSLARFLEDSKVSPNLKSKSCATSLNGDIHLSALGLLFSSRIQDLSCIFVHLPLQYTVYKILWLFIKQWVLSAAKHDVHLFLSCSIHCSVWFLNDYGVLFYLDPSGKRIQKCYWWTKSKSHCISSSI